MDRETAIQVVLEELRWLAEGRPAVTPAPPPLPPPLETSAPPSVALGYDAYLAGSSPDELRTIECSVLRGWMTSPLQADDDAPVALRYVASSTSTSDGPRVSADRLLPLGSVAPPAQPYLAPKRPRRAYGDRSMPPAAPPVPGPAIGAPVTLQHAIEAMLDAHALDWAPTQRQNCRTYLLSPTGRFQLWCTARGISSIDDLTTTEVAAFLATMLDATSGPGLRASTVAKFRGHLRGLARFQATTPGFGNGLRDIDRIPPPRMPRDAFAVALTPDQEERILAACPSTRDRLILELFLATGVRVSEMAALTLTSVLFDARPPRAVVRGSVHDPNCTKNRRPRQVPFRHAYASLPRRLSDWIQHERDPGRQSQRHELFLGRPRVPSHQRAQEPLGIYGFERLCTRIGERAGVHFSPHILRHTWATRLVNAGVQPIHLMEVGGWSSIEMVRRYYTPNDDEILAAIAAAGA
jgi:integrase